MFDFNAEADVPASEPEEDPSPMLVLARSIAAAGQPLSLSSLQDQCSTAACKMLEELSLVSQKFGPEIAFSPSGDARVELRPSPTNPSMLDAELSIPMPNSHYGFSFKAPRSGAVSATERALARCLIGAHPSYCYGMAPPSDDQAPVEDADEKERLEFLAALGRSGRSGSLLRSELIAEHAWNWPRTSMEMDLEELVGEAAELGLLPKNFGNCKITLGGGFPGEPTTIFVFDIFKEGESRHGYGGSSIMGASPTSSRYESSWELPSLDQGEEVIWAALCELLAAGNASCWPGAPQYIAQQDPAALLAATERALLGALPSPPPPAPRRRPSL